MPKTCNALLVAALLATTVGIEPATAGVWENEGIVTTSVRYNDNPALITELQDPQSTLSVVAAAQAEFRFSDPNREFTITPKLVQTYYPDSDFSELNQTDYFLRASTNTSGRLFNWGVSGSYDYQSILTSEDSDPSDPDQTGDANFLRADDRRERYSISPTFSWAPTSKDLIAISASFARTDFDLDFTGRADSNNYNASINYQRQLNQRQSIGIVASLYISDAERLAELDVCPDGSITDTVNRPGECAPLEPLIFIANVQNNSDGNSLQLTYNYQLSERLRSNFAFGRQDTKLKNTFGAPLGSVVTNGSFKSNEYRAGIASEGPRLDWDFNLSRSVAPTDLGSPSDKVQARGTISYRLSELVAFSLQGVAFTQKQKNPNRTTQNEFYRADATLTWRLTRNWSVTNTYIFRNRNPNVTTFGPADEDGDSSQNQNSNLRRKSNAFTVFVRYKFD